MQHEHRTVSPLLSDKIHFCPYITAPLIKGNKRSLKRGINAERKGLPFDSRKISACDRHALVPMIAQHISGDQKAHEKKQTINFASGTAYARVQASIAALRERTNSCNLKVATQCNIADDAIMATVMAPHTERSYGDSKGYIHLTRESSISKGENTEQIMKRKGYKHFSHCLQTHSDDMNLAIVDVIKKEKNNKKQIESEITNKHLFTWRSLI